MRNPFHTPFAAVFCNEVLLNSKRVAPYVLMVLFAAKATLWWGWGPAVARGWATNSDFYIRRNLLGFSFILGLPIFTAIMMGNIVVRDFRLGVDPLIFSKPVGRASYLLGMFFCTFFVLVCCQAAFPITFFLLQWVPFSGMVKQPWKVVPFFKHFLIVVVISHLVLAAFYFAAGTLTRNEKVVFGLAACFYPALIAFQKALENLPVLFRVLLDPVGSGTAERQIEDPWTQNAEVLNNLVARYGTKALVNRTSMFVISVVCLLIVYLRFTIAPLKQKEESFTKLTLLEASDAITYRTDTVLSYGLGDIPFHELPTRDLPALPKVTFTRGVRATLSKCLPPSVLILDCFARSEVCSLFSHL